ncbi:MAG: T9SS type A sorting domain-containing protein [Flavobacteriaceae bacterium]|nr:T9SS type A sorting domain-containing protein [Flavobacteriaceae bacterium]
MKKTLGLTLLVLQLSFGQSPINNYTNTIETTYFVITSNDAIDHSSSGSNLTWNFTSLSQNDSNTDTYATPNASQLSTYPGTTSVLTITNASNPSVQNNLYIKDVANEISMTGVSGEDLMLNYATDNATLGTFPLNYNYSNTDNVAGNYQYTTYSGNFNGTLTTVVDAYGTLNLNDLGNGAYSGNVTRLKTEQNLSFDYSIYPNVGTAIQTSYFYYDDTDGRLIFRSTSTSFNIPLAGINDTVVTHEAISTPNLSVDYHNLDHSIALYPNPTKAILNINSNANTIYLLEVYDINAKRIMHLDHPQNKIDLEALQRGLYIIKIYTEEGFMIKKIMKQ